MRSKIAAATWLIVVFIGAWSLAHHAAVPGPKIHAVETWPVEDRLPHSVDSHTLVMTLHPDCPCSCASVNELEVLMTRSRGHVKAIVLFAEPHGLVIDGAALALWRSASGIDGVNCLHDRDGQLSASFGAQTSGQVFLYDAAGALQFSGGITPSRGHAGDNDGLDAITAIVDGITPATRQTPVFGCSLR